jgi:2-keto-4-pentenoate hydratase
MKRKNQAMDRISIAADALIDAEYANTVLKEFPNLSAPKSIEEAFLIQDAVLKKRGGEIAAWKVGPGSGEITITCAPITVDRVFKSPAKLANSNRLKGIECEIAFRLGNDLPNMGTTYSRDDIKNSIKTVTVAIEAVETRFDSWPVADPLWALADNQSNEALIIGEEIEFFDEQQLKGLEGRLVIDQLEIVANAGFPGGDPLSLIAELANHMSNRSSDVQARGLRSGDIITTGSWNGVDFAAQNSLIKAYFNELGSATLEFTS